MHQEVRAPKVAKEGGAVEITQRGRVRQLVKSKFFSSTEGYRKRSAQKAEYSDRRIIVLRNNSNTLQNLQIPALLFDNTPLINVSGAIGNIGNSIVEGDNAAVDTAYRFVMLELQKKQAQLEAVKEDLMRAASLDELSQKIKNLVQGHDNIDSSFTTAVIQKLEQQFSDFNSISGIFVFVVNNQVVRNREAPQPLEFKVSAEMFSMEKNQQKKAPDWLDQAVLQAVSRNYFESTIARPTLSLQELLNMLLEISTFLIEPDTTASSVYQKLADAINSGQVITSNDYPVAIQAAINTALKNHQTSSTEALSNLEDVSSGVNWSDSQISTLFQNQILTEAQKKDMTTAEQATQNAFGDQKMYTLLDAGQITIGRNLVNQQGPSKVVIPNNFVSKTPAVLMRTGNTYSITTTKSAVHVNGVHVSLNQPYTLKNGDVLLFGGVTGEAFVFKANPDENTVSLELHQPFYRVRKEKLLTSPETRPSEKPKQSEAKLSELLKGARRYTLDSDFLFNLSAQEQPYIQFGIVGWHSKLFGEIFGIEVTTDGTITLTRGNRSEQLQKGFTRLKVGDVLQVGLYPNTVNVTIDQITNIP